VEKTSAALFCAEKVLDFLRRQIMYFLRRRNRGFAVRIPSHPNIRRRMDVLRGLSGQAEACQILELATIQF
jgi:hypothetical protein